MAEVILVRHGRTRLNAERRLQGRVDEPLDDLGFEQAASLARHLTSVLDGDVSVVSSPLARARQTAEVVARSLGLAVESDERWIEMSYGEFDGRKDSDVPADLWSSWRRDPSFAPPGGESLLDVHQRVRPACEQLVSLPSGRTLVVVSHVSPIKSAVAWALGVGVESSWRMHLENASISRLSVGDRVALLAFNQTGHLRP